MAVLFVHLFGIINSVTSIFVLFLSSMNEYDKKACKKVLKTIDATRYDQTRSVTEVEKSAIGCYSLERIWLGNSVKVIGYTEDTSAAKHLYLPAEKKFCFDLTDGYNGPHWSVYSDDSLPYFLHWIINNKSDFDVYKPNFVCFRGLLSLIMLTPFERVSDWCVHAVMFNKTIYMLDRATRRKISDEEHRSEYHNKASYGGYRFEHYISSTKQNECPKKYLVNGLNYNQFNMIMKTSLNEHSFLYPAEVDCKNGDKLIEIKTAKEITDSKQLNTFINYKFVKWWSQSYLSGVEQVVCGFRDRHFNVRKIKKYSTDSLCDKENSNTCLNFLDIFLKLVKDCVTETDTTYDFYWSPFNNEIQCRIFSQKDTLLPIWFRRALLQK